MARRRVAIVLGVQVKRSPSLRDTGVTKAAILKTAMLETGAFWHERVFAGHFEPSARTEYAGQMDPRNRGYIFQRKLPEGEGLGRTVYNRFKNQSVRWMRSERTISGSSRQVRVVMNAPAYFTHPFVGTIQDDNGRRRIISRQPDKPKEVTTVSNEDRRQLQAFYINRVERGFREALQRD